MIRPISHYDWQMLRSLVRAGTPLAGKVLRIYPSRQTKDGTYFDKLVVLGLLVVVKVLPVPPVREGTTKKIPVQFHTLYDLTENGRYAAEHGEYETGSPTLHRAPSVTPIKGRRGRRIDQKKSQK